MNDTTHDAGDLQDAVIAVDLATGDRTVLSDAVTGVGPTLVSPLGIAVAGDVALVTENFHAAVIAVDLASGNRTILSDEASGGPAFGELGGIAFAETHALVVNLSPRALYAVDLDLGQRVIISR